MGFIIFISYVFYYGLSSVSLCSVIVRKILTRSLATVRGALKEFGVKSELNLAVTWVG
ncbi:hypothetical protein CK203_076685 [Vitis vinifera]|uniref:Uncharacterized protein n=1 Tax=Vitis vinifera TaxID=29760 RepID=A0A438EPV1_VITVI|nr:hypothetical protein CK203_076685 [Vitis vinifera]